MISINSTNYYSPNFKAYRHTIKNKAGDVINRGDTCLFRYDLDLGKLIKFLEDKYKDVPKVNIIVHACSDGEEAYSFLAKLFYMLGEKAQKYLPVIARDVCEEHLACAKSGNFFIESFEKEGLLSEMNNSYHEFFDESIDELFRHKLTIKDKIKNNITFSKGNIMEDIHKFKLKNTVLFARNFWPYLGEENVDKLAMFLSHKMDPSSTLIIGNFDRQYNIDLLLDIYGIKESYKVDNVFEKPKRIKLPKPKITFMEYFFKKVFAK